MMASTLYGAGGRASLTGSNNWRTSLIAIPLLDIEDGLGVLHGKQFAQRGQPPGCVGLDGPGPLAGHLGPLGDAETREEAHRQRGALTRGPPPQNGPHAHALM